MGKSQKKKIKIIFAKLTIFYLAKYDLFDLAVTSDKKYWSLI